MLSRGVGLTRLQRANLYPTVTPDPDPVRKVCRRNRTHTNLWWKCKNWHTKLDVKNDKAAIYATKETIYLGYALPVQMKRP